MNSSAVFVDTAAWIGLLNERDNLHLPARRVMDQLRQENTPLVTTEFVLLEVADALSQPVVRLKTVKFIESIFQVPSLKIVPISQSLWLQGWTLYKQRQDKDWGLTDCISFTVMKQEKIDRAFTSDRHFEQAGFITLLVA